MLFKLKALLKIHNGTRCETHDLLGCPCIVRGPKSSTPDISEDTLEDLPDNLSVPTPTFTSAKNFKEQTVSQVLISLSSIQWIVSSSIPLTEKTNSTS